MDHFERTRELGDEHVDWLGHVNNVVWLQLVIDLATAHSESVGLAAGDYRALGAAWAVRRHEVDYHRAAFSGDVIREQTWVEEMRGARSVRWARFVRPADGALLVESRTLWAFTDLATGRPRRVPPAVAGRFPVLPGAPEA